MLPTILATKWLRLVAAIFIGLLVYAGLLSVFKNKETVWWPDRPEALIDDGVAPPPSGDVDWSRFAYTQYATNSAYLCNSVMFFEILHRLGSRADRVLMYPSKMMTEGGPDAPTTSDQRLLQKAADEYNVRLVPIEVQHRSGNDGNL